MNAVLLLLTAFAIFNITIATRNPGTSDLVLIPFRSFSEAKEQPEVYRTMLMNVFLFFPVGLTLPFFLPDQFPHRIVSSICAGVFVSIIIEISQYIFHLGQCEIDDIIMNTLGVALGVLALKAIGMWRFAQILTQLSVTYFGMSSKEWCGSSNKEYLEALMGDIFKGGNFGIKDRRNRINQEKLITNAHKTSVDETGLVKRFIRTMNEKAGAL